MNNVINVTSKNVGEALKQIPYTNFGPYRAQMFIDATVPGWEHKEIQIVSRDWYDNDLPTLYVEKYNEDKRGYVDTPYVTMRAQSTDYLTADDFEAHIGTLLEAVEGVRAMNSFDWSTAPILKGVYGKDAELLTDSVKIKDNAVDVEEAVYQAIMEASPVVQDALVDVVRNYYDVNDFESTDSLANTIWNDINYLISQLPEDLQEDYEDTYGY